jgi:hypothetical protein
MPCGKIDLEDFGGGDCITYATKEVETSISVLSGCPWARGQLFTNDCTWNKKCRLFIEKNEIIVNTSH